MFVSVPLGVYERLKRLEDRILELEGCSPEVFQLVVRVCNGRGRNLNGI